MNKVLDHMYTKISIDIQDSNDNGIFNELDKLFGDIENRFSTFKPDSEVSKYATGSVAQNATSQDLKQIILLCKEYEVKTDGYFTPYFNKSFNPTGIVKGWAIKQAANYLHKRGINSFMINAGGDIICSSDGKKTWNIAVANPKNSTGTIATLSLQNGAVATSGSSERGNHIFNPKNGKNPNYYLSTTVICSDIIKADVMATTIFAMGKKSTSLIAKNPDIQTILVDKSGNVSQS